MTELKKELTEIMDAVISEVHNNPHYRSSYLDKISIMCVAKILSNPTIKEWEAKASYADMLVKESNMLRVLESKVADFLAQIPCPYCEDGSVPIPEEPSQFLPCDKCNHTGTASSLDDALKSIKK